MADALSSMPGEIDAGKRALLAAAASGGTAGVAAFKEGQAQLGLAQQQSVGRAATRAALIGGPEAQGFQTMAQEGYGRGIANLGTAQTMFEADMSRRLSANQDYLSKAGAAIPAYRAQTDRLVGFKQQAAQAALDKKRAEEAAKDPTSDWLLGQGQSLADTVNHQLGTSGRRSTSDLRGTVDKNGQHVFGSGATLANVSADDMGDVDNAVFAANKLGGIGPAGVDPVNAARAVATSLGLDEGETNGILTPSKTGTWTKASAPAQDTVAKALATKYDAKGVTYETAKSVVNNVDYQRDSKAILEGWGGKTKAEVQQDLYNYYVRDRGWLAEYYILIGEILPLLPESE